MGDGQGDVEELQEDPIVEEEDALGAILLEASRYPDPSYHVWLFFNPAISANKGYGMGQKEVYTQADPVILGRSNT